MRNVYVAHRGYLSVVGLQKVIEEAPRYTCAGFTQDGYEAVREVLSIRPDVVVLGQALDAMNGGCAAREIIREWPQARIIGLVRRICGEVVVGFLEAGARGVMSECEFVREFHESVCGMNGPRPYLGAVVMRGLSAQGVYEIVVQHSRSRRLSHREVQVLQQIAEGYSTRDMADRLCVSAKTVETHRARIMEKLSIRSIAGLTKYAIQIGITEVSVY